MKVKLKYDIQEPYDDNLFKVREIEDVEAFRHPDEKNLLSPWQLDNMKQALDLTKIFAYSPALIVVDSDSDGYNSGSLLMNYLEEAYPDWHFDYFLHSKKQHGLEDVVEERDLSQYPIVFLPDAGSNDDEYIKEYPGTVFIILDHHLRTVEDEPPTNMIIVNNQTSDNYPNKALCGAGVAWQFCRAMDEARNTDYAWKYIDQVAVAIIGDVMNITTPENAYIIEEGLHSIRNEFLRALCNNAAYSLGAEITPMGIAFYIVPMINAMCRMGTPDEKDRMFNAFANPHKQVECHKRGVTKGTMIDVYVESVRECTNAKSRQKREQTKMAELCEKQIIENDLTQNKIIIIILDETFDDIPSELNGLAATQLANKYNRPVYILRENKDGELKGSGRGLSTIDMLPLKDFMESSGLTNFVQGHALAHGFGMDSKNLDRLIDWINETLKDVDLDSKTWYVDFKVKARDPKLTTIIESMDDLSKYWGQGFPQPYICVEDLRVNRSQIQIMGKNSDTVKITCNGVAYMFFKRDFEEVKALTQYTNAKLNVVGTANLNYYNGRTTPQIFVEDYTIENDDLTF